MTTTLTEVLQSRTLHADLLALIGGARS